MKNPPHPGDFIKTEIVAPAGLTVTATTLMRMQASYNVAQTRKRVR